MYNNSNVSNLLCTSDGTQINNNPISAAAQYITGPNIQQTSYDVVPSTSTNNNNSRRNANQPQNAMEINGQVALAQIQEATTNIERISNKATIKVTLADTIREQGKKEKIVRQATISFKNKDIDTKLIANTIDEEWVFKLNQAPVTFWNDKEFIHCQFINNEAKINFLSSGITNLPNIINRALPMNNEGENFKRRPIRMIINNVRPSIRTERVIEIIKNCTDFDTEIEDVKDGSPHPITKTRSIFFRVNSHGLRLLIDRLNGEIPYADRASQVKARLRVKINCKPWQCKDCLALGTHQCEGKKCKNCSSKGHLTKDCQNKLRFCGNCKQKGHRSNDLHCSTYLNEIAKELRKMDIPMDMFESKDSRLNLAKCIQLK